MRRSIKGKPGFYTFLNFLGLSQNHKCLDSLIFLRIVLAKPINSLIFSITTTFGLDVSEKITILSVGFLIVRNNAMKTLSNV